MFLVADGMGGEQSGEIASRMAAETFAAAVVPFIIDSEATLPFESFEGDYFLNTVRYGAEAANLAVYQYSMDHEDHRGMGSTLTAAVGHENRLYVAHVGDSRLYRLSRGGIAQLTEDHSRVQEWVKAGLLSPEEARTHAKRHVITRCVGRRKKVEVDAFSLESGPDDLFLVCSDGLTEMMEDRDILGLIGLGKNLEKTGRALVAESNRLGGRDNITVVLFRCTRL